MTRNTYNSIVVLGPTASGKTRLGVRLAAAYEGEVLSADSRQVYQGLNIGSGKDLDEYTIDGHAVPYHLIDIATLAAEFSAFDFQQAAYRAFEAVVARDKLPVIVGGTGLYLEAVLRKYGMVAVPEDAALRAALADCPMDVLTERLAGAKGTLHNTTDLETRERAVRAIEIAEYSAQHTPEPAPDIRPIILGVLWDRAALRTRILVRLRERLNAGMIDEVAGLHQGGIPWERLERLGLEYRFVAEYLQGAIRNRNDLIQKLHAAICQFAKRQDTWFRRMERNGTAIHWIPEGNYESALQALAAAGFRA